MHYLALLVCGILAINIRVARPSESESDDNELGERLDKDYDDTWSTDLHFHDDDLNGNPVEIRDKRFLGKLLETQRTIYFHNDQRYWMDIECGPEKDGGQKGIRSMEPYGFSLLQQGIVFYASPPLWCTVKSNRKIIKFKAYGSGYPEAPTGKEVHWKITEDGLFLDNFAELNFGRRPISNGYTEFVEFEPVDVPPVEVCMAWIDEQFLTFVSRGYYIKTSGIYIGTEQANSWTNG